MQQQTHRERSLQTLAGLLEEVSDGRIATTEEFLRRMPGDSHPHAMAVLSNVHHYLADTDIRQKDPDYRDMQDRDMAKLIAALRRGASIDELLEYNFL
jgi:hypothetical protein